MNHQWFAKITVPRQDGKTRTGSGFPVVNGLLMTARHVVEFAERDTTQPITVHWLDGTVTETLHTLDYQFEDESCDVVIFRCPTPLNVKPPAVDRLLSQDKIISCSEWQSVGFPKVNQFDLKALTGKFQVDTGQKIDLVLYSPIDSVIKNAPELNMQDGWGGMSGAAVFGIQSQKIEALIVVCDQWMAGELKAVSMPYLMTLPAFRKALGLIDADQQHQQYLLDQQQKLKQELIKIEHQTPGFFKELAQTFIPAVVALNSEQLIECLQELIDPQDPGKLLKPYREAVVRSLNNDKHLVVQARVLFHLLLSAYSEPTATVGNVLQVPVATPMAVEHRLAAKYGLSPDFEYQLEQSKSPAQAIRGKFAIDGDTCGIKEVGWPTNAQAQQITEVVQIAVGKLHQQTFGYLPNSVLTQDSFELELLNETLLEQRNTSADPRLIRLEILQTGNDETNPLHNDEVCRVLQQEWLPNLIIARYGKERSKYEMALLIQVNEFYRILQPYL